jgi:hypothetical protein
MNTTRHGRTDTERQYSWQDRLLYQSRYAPDTELALIDGSTFWAAGPLIDVVASIVERYAILGDFSIYAEWWMENKIPQQIVEDFLHAGFVHLQERDGTIYFIMSEHIQLIAASMVVRVTDEDGTYLYGTRDPRTGKKTRLAHPIPRLYSSN